MAKEKWGDYKAHRDKSMGVVIRTEAELVEYGDKILNFIYGDEDLSKLSDYELCIILTGVVFGLGFGAGWEDWDKAQEHD